MLLLQLAWQYVDVVRLYLGGSLTLLRLRRGWKSGRRYFCGRMITIDRCWIDAAANARGPLVPDALVIHGLAWHGPRQRDLFSLARGVQIANASRKFQLRRQWNARVCA